MMRGLVVPVLLLLALASAWPAAAQDRDARRERLQGEIMQRFMENYRRQSGLSDEQFARFRDVTRRAFEARSELQRRERDLWRALEGQMRPGVAADADSVTRLLDGLVEVQTARVERLRAEHAEFAAFLSPVQQAQLTIAFRRLQNQIERIMQQRLQGRDGPPGP